MTNATSKCPVLNHSTHSSGSVANQHWWPEQLNLKMLNQNSSLINPMKSDFDYKKEFKKLNFQALKQDLHNLMTDSQDWWPADYGHYGPLFVRMAWHSAGTYRTYDGRGGASTGSQRFSPLNSWPDNGNLDKARRLLWPIKQKHGQKISWADLMILAGNVAMESMGLETKGFGGGRADIWEPEEDIYWGSETQWLDDERYSGERELESPLGAVQMGLIYVNPEGPNGNPDPLKSAFDIRDTFARMGMDDYETVALIAGGHTFGKGHGAGPENSVGSEPEGAPLEQMGLGWVNAHGSGKGSDTTTAGFEGAWTINPTQWDMGYFDVLFGYEWEQVKSPMGVTQWAPTSSSNAQQPKAAHDASSTEPLMMLTSDIAIKTDPIYVNIAKNFHQNPQEFATAYAQAWFKLTHRDMGPKSRYLGEEVPSEDLIWQDPLPQNTVQLTEQDIKALKTSILKAGLSTSELVATAWASASTFRGSDYRGGANGARIALAPQKDWAVNNPQQLSKVLSALNEIKSNSNTTVSLADLIVLGGSVAIEQVSGITVPFTPGRTDASAEKTDAESFEVLEPKYDGFRNFKDTQDTRSTESLLVDKAQLLTLTAPEMTVLIGGLRCININTEATNHGVLTNNQGALSNDFFKNILDINIEWKSVDKSQEIFNGYDRESGKVKWTGSRADLVFGSNSILRSLSEVYASEDANQKFIADFVLAWTKVMNLDRFDVN